MLRCRTAVSVCAAGERRPILYSLPSLLHQSAERCIECCCFKVEFLRPTIAGLDSDCFRAVCQITPHNLDLKELKRNAKSILTNR